MTRIIEFWKRLNPSTRHIRHIQLRGDHNHLCANIQYSSMVVQYSLHAKKSDHENTKNTYKISATPFSDNLHLPLQGSGMENQVTRRSLLAFRNRL